MRSVSSLSRRLAGGVCFAALSTLAALAFTTPATAADLETGAYAPPPPAYAPAPPAYVEQEYVVVPPAPVPVYRPYAWGAPYWYGRPYWRGYWGPRYAGYGGPWGYRPY